MRNGLILRFEFTYELAHRTLRRYLRETAGSPGAIDEMPFADLIRTANQQTLLGSDWPAWRRLRDLRARTSHSYDPAVAAIVIAAIPEFLAEATHLHTQLRHRLA